MLLVHPPVSRPCEPPAGLARLAGALRRHGLEAVFLDANAEGLSYLLASQPAAPDTWSRRACAHVTQNLAALTTWGAYGNIGLYTRAVTELNRVLALAARPVAVSLANYQDATLSPLRSDDLLAAAERPECNAFFAYFSVRLCGLIEAHTPRLIGFSLNYLSQALTTFAMIGYVRRIAPQIRVVLGGGLVNSWVRRPGWHSPFAGLVDELVAGPGEVKLLDLAGAAAAGQGPYPPDYGPFAALPYLAPGRVLPYNASTGCYWSRCSFCPERAEQNPYIALAPRRVIEDLARLTAGYQPRLIHLLDNALSPALLTALAEHPPGAPWYGFARITRALTDLDFCLALKRSGCVMLQLGLESGDQEVLDALNKAVDLADTRQVLANLKTAGIATYAYLLFGTPAEGPDSARKTLAFVREQADCLDYLNLALFNLPLASPEGDALETYDFYAGDLSLYKGFVHPQGWDRNRVRQFLDKEFRRDPAVAAILRRDPPVFTSNHAPFFHMDPGHSPA